MLVDLARLSGVLDATRRGASRAASPAYARSSKRSKELGLGLGLARAAELMRKEKHALGLRQRNEVNGDERCWLRSAAGTLAAIDAVGYQAAALWPLLAGTG